MLWRKCLEEFKMAAQVSAVAISTWRPRRHIGFEAAVKKMSIRSFKCLSVMSTSRKIVRWISGNRVWSEELESHHIARWIWEPRPSIIISTKSVWLERLTLQQNCGHLSPSSQIDSKNVTRQFGGHRSVYKWCQTNETADSTSYHHISHWW